MENKITIRGKEIDIDALSDNQVLKLYSDLKERELVLTEKILSLENKSQKNS